MVQLYPRKFRELFADDMSSLFRRQCRGVLERHGRLGLLWFGAKTLISVVAAALYERLTARETRALPKRRGGPRTAVGHDLRYGARSLVKNPGFTLLAAGTLALGIGVNTTIFSLVNSLLFSELPITDPDTFGLIEAVSTESNDTESPATLADFALLKEDTNVFVDAAVAVREYFVLAGEGEPAHVQALSVSDNLFRALGRRYRAGPRFRRRRGPPWRSTRHRFESRLLEPPLRRRRERRGRRNPFGWAAPYDHWDPVAKDGVRLPRANRQGSGFASIPQRLRAIVKPF